jgi:methylthioribose-1-phosphate isomerase
MTANPRAAKEAVQALRWVEDHLQMIDQRVLPQEFRYLSFHTASQIAEAIRSMVVRGAPAIGCASAYGVALEALSLINLSAEEFYRKLEIGFYLLEKSRPTAVNLSWALTRMRRCWKSCASFSQNQVATALLDEAHAIFREDIEANRAIGDHGAALLKSGDRVLTHCNAGALATAGYGTALGIIRSAVAMGKSISVVADETRPFLQGARLTAWEMVQEGIPTTLIADSMAGHLMATGHIDVVVVGADRVARNGDVANKIGTYMVAVLAHRHNIPFYVACPRSTIDFSMANGALIEIEERGPDEILGFNGVEWAPTGVSVRNPAFDITPSDLIDAIVTEVGVLHSPSNDLISELFSDISKK